MRSERDEAILEGILDDLPPDHPLVLQAERAEIVRELMLDGASREQAESDAGELMEAGIR